MIILLIALFLQNTPFCKKITNYAFLQKNYKLPTFAKKLQNHFLDRLVVDCRVRYLYFNFLSG